MGRQAIAPSAMPGCTGETAREMTQEETEAVMDSFAGRAIAWDADSPGFSG